MRDVSVLDPVSEPAAYPHVKGVLRKLGVNSQLAAVALARDAGWPTD